jgi:co-chaperonin GroES (HSP10)
MKSEIGKGLAVVLLSMILGWWMCVKYYKGNTDTNETVTKERIVTRIVERKDGTKETVIVDDRSSKSKTNISKVKNWGVSVGTSLTEKAPIYSISVDRKILGDFYIGGYAKTDSEVGVFIRYTF